MSAALDRAVFFTRIRAHPFGGHLSADQVEGMTAILDACPADLATDPLAYCLATPCWETDRTMQPIEEYRQGRGKPYGQPKGPWHQAYYGRGLVQLTHLPNYQRANAELHALGVLKDGEDMVRRPELAMRPDAAATILFQGMIHGWFTGKGLGTYFTSKRSDPLNARRIINGLDKAAEIKALYVAFRDALQAAGHAPAGATLIPARTIVAPKINTPAPPMAKKAKPKPRKAAARKGHR